MKLRALEIEDLPWLYRWENDADSWADSATHNPLSKHLLREYIESSTGDIYRDGQLRLVLENDGESIGCMDFFDFDAQNRKAALGMYIAPEARGKGLGAKALQLMEDYAFRFLNLEMIYAIIAADNEPCLRLYRKAGYQESTPLAHWILRSGNPVDAILFQKLK